MGYLMQSPGLAGRDDVSQTIWGARQTRKRYASSFSVSIRPNTIPTSFRAARTLM